MTPGRTKLLDLWLEFLGSKRVEEVGGCRVLLLWFSWCFYDNDVSCMSWGIRNGCVSWCNFYSPVFLKGVSGEAKVTLVVGEPGEPQHAQSYEANEYTFQ